MSMLSLQLVSAAPWWSNVSFVIAGLNRQYSSLALIRFPNDWLVEGLNRVHLGKSECMHN